MAEVSYIDVTSLDVVPDGVQNDDVLLLVRSNADGTKTCYRVPGSKLRATLDVAPMMWPRSKVLRARYRTGRHRWRR